MAGVVVLTGAARAQGNRAVVNSFHVGGAGQWDYVTVDSATHRIFLTRTTHTEVVDAETGKVLGDIPGQVSAHGVALAPGVGRGFITDGGGSGSIVVFDLKTYATLGRLKALPDVDGIVFDATSNRVLAVSGDAKALLVFPAAIDLAGAVDSPAGKLDAPIALGGSPEFLAADSAGRAYVDLKDRNEVAVVDLLAGKVIARWPVAPGGVPVGLALDSERHRLFVGCRSPQKLVVMSTEDGKVLGSVPIGAGVDAVVYDEGTAFASTRDGFLTAVAEQDGSYGIQQAIKTSPGARTVGVDTGTHRLYLPTAVFEDPGVSAPGSRQKQKPDSFMVLVVDRTGGR